MLDAVKFPTVEEGCLHSPLPFLEIPDIECTPGVEASQWCICFPRVAPASKVEDIVALVRYLSKRQVVIRHILLDDGLDIEQFMGEDQKAEDLLVRLRPADLLAKHPYGVRVEPIAVAPQLLGNRLFVYKRCESIPRKEAFTSQVAWNSIESPEKAILECTTLFVFFCCGWSRPLEVLISRKRFRAMSTRPQLCSVLVR